VGGFPLPEAFQQAGDLTGLSVATDGVTLVIGAPQMAGANRNSFGANLLTTSPVNPTILQAPGKAYVYQRDVNSNWMQIATLMASAGADKDGFGASVAVDGNTIVVGADGATNKQGRAYIFEKPVGGWSNAAITTETAELLPLIAGVALSASNTYLGHAVDVKGGTVVVGQWGGVPAAYIFERPAAGWASAVPLAQTATLQPLIGANPAAIAPVLGTVPEQFGMSVAIDSDPVAGTETVVVGGNLLGAGALYLYEKPALVVGGWASLGVNAAPTATLTLSPAIDLLDNGQNGSRSFGFDVDIKGDTVVAGATRFDVTSLLGTVSKDAGAVFVFEKPLAGWVSGFETKMLTAPTPIAFQSFGRSVAVTKDRVLVGTFTNPALRADPIVGGFGLAGNALAPTAANAPQGRAYIFDKPIAASWAVYNPVLTPAALWQSPVGSIDDMFGYSVAGANTTYVAGGFALDTDLPAPGSAPGAVADGVVDNNVGSAAVKEATVLLEISNSLPAGTVPVANAQLTYTVTVANNDPVDTATNVVVTDQLPAGLTFVSATPTQGTPCIDLNAAVLPVQPANVECNLGSLLPNTSASIAMVANVTDPLLSDHTASVIASESLNNASVTSSSVNVAPTADAGLAQTVNEGDLVTLSGVGTDTAPGTIASYAWTQVSGDTVVLSGAITATATFTAPTLTANSVLPFRF
ncbi:MAG: hypothetical protein Q9N68_12070, partial [Gammaproteobacteria bacterium]|nr:hypothetical protein [Gammaproteobacteria bacterium]